MIDYLLYTIKGKFILESELVLKILEFLRELFFPKIKI